MAYRCWGQLRSGDGPLSVRARPSSIKRDCDRRATSTGEKRLVNVHAKSRLTPEPLRTLRSETKGQAGACPDRTRAIPCDVRAVTMVTTRTRPPRCQAGMGATLGATGTNNFPILWTCPDSRWGTSPRSRTDLNGPGLQYGHLRIRRLGVRVPPSAPQSPQVKTLTP